MAILTLSCYKIAIPSQYFLSELNYLFFSPQLHPRLCEHTPISDGRVGICQKSKEQAKFYSFDRGSFKLKVEANVVGVMMTLRFGIKIAISSFHVNISKT